MVETCEAFTLASRITAPRVIAMASSMLRECFDTYFCLNAPIGQNSQRSQQQPAPPAACQSPQPSVSGRLQAFDAAQPQEVQSSPQEQQNDSIRAAACLEQWPPLILSAMAPKAFWSLSDFSVSVSTSDSNSSSMSEPLSKCARKQA